MKELKNIVRLILKNNSSFKTNNKSNKKPNALTCFSLFALKSQTCHVRSNENKYLCLAYRSPSSQH